VPYLQELKQIESKPFMKYKVYSDLKQHHEALLSIAESPEEDHFEQALELVRK
jgi:hypothetical protein